MQKLFFAVISICLIVSCSTTPNNNSGTTTTVVPLVPTSLTGSVTNVTHVNLTWTDNATNEDGYKVERKTGNGTYALLGSTGVNINQYVDSTVTINTTYTYRVYAYNAAGNSLNYSNEYTVTINSNVVVVLPTVTTTIPTSITTTSAVAGGNVTNEGGAPVTSRGVVWCTCLSPTTALSTKTVDGTGTGSFTSNMTVLTSNADYYVRAYATNSAGTAYGNIEFFQTAQLYSYSPWPNITDANGNIYPCIINNCGQIMTTKNLNVSRYRDGSIIPQITNASQWQNLTTGAWCWYNNDSATYWQYGKLYNWYAVNDSRGLVPQGWHVPTDADWNKLVKCIDPTSDTTFTGAQSATAGGTMKEAGTNHWITPNTGASNSSGLVGLPGGTRSFDGIFDGIGNYGHWWSATEKNQTYAWYRALYNNSASLYREGYSKKSGFSVRIFKD